MRSDQLIEGYNQLMQQRRDGREGEGGVSKGELMELDQWECLGLVM